MDPITEAAGDPLSKLQLLIARRADELARDNKVVTPLNLHCWFAAETELIGEAFLDEK